VVHITRGLLDGLLAMSADRDPESVSAVLASTPAGEFENATGVDSSTPILTHFYFPDASGSVTAVFGVDLGTPAGSGRARFVSHPQGPLAATREDTFAAAVLIAIPPWDVDACAAFDRENQELSMNIIDADPPQETLTDNIEAE